jgi:transposase-like protein
MEIEMLDHCNIKGDKAWQELVSQFESRTISSAEFCKLHNISRGSIYKWRKYFLDDQHDFDGSGDFISLSINDSKLSSSSAEFIKINSPLKMINRCGVVIELHAGCNISELKSIIEVLNATK